MLEWIKDCLLIRDEDIIKTKGKDALQYLLFQRYLIYYLILLNLICLGVVLPINLQGQASKQLIQLSVNYTSQTCIISDRIG